MKKVLFLILVTILSATNSVTAQEDTFEFVDEIGVNLATAEFSEYVNGNDGYNGYYVYPGCEDVARWSEYFGIIRYNMRMERLFDDGELTSDIQYVHEVLDCMEELGSVMIMDAAHNYARIREDVIINGEIITNERFLQLDEYAEFCEAMASEFGGDPALAAFNIMTEPHDMPDGYWFQLAQSCIDAYRRGDTTTPLMIPGGCWSGTDQWQNCTENAELYLLSDPSDRLIFSASAYFDADGDGEYSDCPSADDCARVVEHLEPFVSWCTEHELRCYLTEIGFPVGDTSWEPYLVEAADYLLSHGIGFSFWAVGPWWGEYQLSLERPEARWMLDVINEIASS